MMMKRSLHFDFVYTYLRSHSKKKNIFWKRCVLFCELFNILWFILFKYLKSFRNVGKLGFALTRFRPSSNIHMIEILKTTSI